MRDCRSVPSTLATDIVTRTQIQLPDKLYRRAKELAADREISLVELVRNGLEYMLTALTPPQAVREVPQLPKLSLGKCPPEFADYAFGPARATDFGVAAEGVRRSSK